MNPIIQYILSRLKERATWTSLGIAVTGLGIGLKPDQWYAITTLGMGLVGVITAFLPPNVQEKDVIPAPAAAPTTPLAQSLADKVVSGQTDTTGGTK